MSQYETSLRDQIAIAMLLTCIAECDKHGEETLTACKNAYFIADCMMRARED